MPQRAAHGQAVDGGHHHVEHDDVGFGLGECSQRWRRRRRPARPGSRRSAAPGRAIVGRPASSSATSTVATCSAVASSRSAGATCTGCAATSTATSSRSDFRVSPVDGTGLLGRHRAAVGGRHPTSVASARPRRRRRGRILTNFSRIDEHARRRPTPTTASGAIDGHPDDHSWRPPPRFSGRGTIPAVRRRRSRRDDGRRGPRRRDASSSPDWRWPPPLPHCARSTPACAP